MLVVVVQALAKQRTWHPSWHQFLMQATIAVEVPVASSETDDSVAENYTPPAYPSDFVAGVRIYRAICTRYSGVAATLHKLSAMRASRLTEAYYGWIVKPVEDVPSAYGKELKEALEDAASAEETTNRKIQQQLVSKKLRRVHSFTQYHPTCLDSLLDSLESMIVVQREDGSRELTPLGAQLPAASPMLKAIMVAEASARRVAMCEQLAEQLKEGEDYFINTLTFLKIKERKHIINDIRQGRSLSAWRRLADEIFIHWKKAADTSLAQLQERKQQDAEQVTHRFHYRAREHTTRIHFTHVLAQAAVASLGATLEIVAATKELKFQSSTTDEDKRDHPTVVCLLLLPGATNDYVFEGTKQDTTTIGPFPSSYKPCRIGKFIWIFIAHIFLVLLFLCFQIQSRITQPRWPSSTSRGRR